MSKVKYEKKFMAVMTERLREYEKIFNAKKEYIRLEDCPFCILYEACCSRCPLIEQFVSSEGETTCSSKYRADMSYWFRNDFIKYKKAAKARYKELIEFLDRIGYEYK